MHTMSLQTNRSINAKGEIMKIWLKRIASTLILLLVFIMYIGYTHEQKKKENNSPPEPTASKTEDTNSKMERMLTNYHICDLALKKGDRGRSFEEGLSPYSDYQQDKTKDSYYSLLPNGILVVISEKVGMGYRCTYDEEVIKVELDRKSVV